MGKKSQSSDKERGRSLTTVEVYRSRFVEFINFCSFFQRTKRTPAANKMDGHSYNAYIVDLLRQLNEALENCNFKVHMRNSGNTAPRRTEWGRYVCQGDFLQVEAMMQEKPAR